MDVRNSELEQAAAALQALAHLSVDPSFALEAESLATALWPEAVRTAGFPVAVREWQVLLRNRFEPRAEGPTG